MTKNIFEAAYAGIQEAKKAYNAAADEAGKDAARALYKEATKDLEGLKGTELRIWKDYETSKDSGNEYLDIDGTVDDDKVEELITCMMDYGFEAFTFSSSWSSAVKTAWLFQKAGCTLAGLIEINSQYTAFMSDEHEKTPAYLFKLN